MSWRRDFSCSLVLLGALLFNLPSCSLLFEAGNASHDAGQIDAGQVDAGQDGGIDVANCGPPLPGTEAIFHIDGNNFSTTVEDFLGGSPGTGVHITLFKEGVTSLAPIPLETTSGPSGCGSAVKLTTRFEPFVELPYNIVAEVQSFDFWFQTNEVTGPQRRGALLTKDGTNSSLGDIALFITGPVSGQKHHVVLRLQDSNFESHFVCSGEVALNEWHHVAVSLGGPNGAELFVDGAQVDDLSADIPEASLGGGCDAKTGAANATLRFNSHDWLWGASNIRSPTVLADDVMKGAVDELRLRSQQFTLDEAAQVYASGAQ